ncbi:helix-turn-helix domain-containing protein [Leptobacterium flavescens]|uniref:Helix-turn-helix domain-containing protein n=1 Tax=Leptobacterium flavescens TaxID=472055 RepID=A0A6P0UIN9_9FLAO|nr:helix-turn-helix transcriptional regulator [Leptobacterium flavescens]NER13104.1 helix-turn-helix domain-containing protein [Leptobacterium flavescens]
MEYLKDKALLEAFGNNLRRLRKEKGFTQEKLAFEIGIEISQISRIERGILNTSVSTANAISKALKVPIRELFDFDRDRLS